MSLVHVVDVRVLDNPSIFLSNFKFEISFECFPPGLDSELEWKLIYVGSAEDTRKDQELDSVLVGPVQIGMNAFVFDAPPPNHSLISDKDIMEVTVILLTCSYKEQEFIRIGYYVNNEYPANEHLLRSEYSEAKSLQAELIKQHLMQQQRLNGENNNTGNNENNNNNNENQSSDNDNPINPIDSNNVYYEIPSGLNLPPLPSIQVDKLHRHILSQKPRVTRFQINWDGKKDLFEMSEQDQKQAMEQSIENQNKNNTSINDKSYEDNEDEDDEDEDSDSNDLSDENNEQQLQMDEN